MPISPVDSEGRPKQVGERLRRERTRTELAGRFTVLEHLHQRPTPSFCGGGSWTGLRTCAAEMAEKQIIGKTSPNKNRTLYFMRDISSTRPSQNRLSRCSLQLQALRPCPLRPCPPDFQYVSRKAIPGYWQAAEKRRVETGLAPSRTAEDLFGSLRPFGKGTTAEILRFTQGLGRARVFSCRKSLKMCPRFSACGELLAVRMTFSAASWTVRDIIGSASNDAILPGWHPRRLARGCIFHVHTRNIDRLLDE